jgi:membrane protein YdbS with pleckstrin-like domain
LVTLQIYTAAGSTFDGAIPGLHPKRAQELQQLIITIRGDDGV